jgi:hypothetical protein
LPYDYTIALNKKQESGRKKEKKLEKGRKQADAAGAHPPIRWSLPAL